MIMYIRHKEKYKTQPVIGLTVIDISQDIGTLLMSLLLPPVRVRVPFHLNFI